MQILAPSIIQKPCEPLTQELPISNIRLKSQKQKERDRVQPSSAPSYIPPASLLNLQQQQGNSIEFSFHPDQTVANHSDSIQKRREGKIFSIVHSAQRERSGSLSSNNSGWKEGRVGISLVSREKRKVKQSLEKKKLQDYSLGSLDSFTGNADSIMLALQDKENKPNATVIKIRQPEFLKSHPLRIARVNGGCMSKLIAQRALQDRKCSYINPQTKQHQ